MSGAHNCQVQGRVDLVLHLAECPRTLNEVKEPLDFIESHLGSDQLESPESKQDAGTEVCVPCECRGVDRFGKLAREKSNSLCGKRCGLGECESDRTSVSRFVPLGDLVVGREVRDVTAVLIDYECVPAVFLPRSGPRREACLTDQKGRSSMRLGDRSGSCSNAEVESCDDDFLIVWDLVPALRELPEILAMGERRSIVANAWFGTAQLDW